MIGNYLILTRWVLNLALWGLVFISVVDLLRAQLFPVDTRVVKFLLLGVGVSAYIMRRIALSKLKPDRHERHQD